MDEKLFDDMRNELQQACSDIKYMALGINNPFSERRVKEISESLIGFDKRIAAEKAAASKREAELVVRVKARVEAELAAKAKEEDVQVAQIAEEVGSPK